MEEKLHPDELLAPSGIGLNAVVVSIGYRLNLLGFLAGDGVDGNFGFWVGISRLSPHDTS